MQNSDALKRKTISGLLWSFTDLFMNQGIQFIVFIILARLLTPDHFGIIAIISIVLAISNSIIDSGFSQALIREKNTNQIEYSTVFFFNLFMAVVFVVLLFFSAPFIGAFFHNDLLVSILRVLSIGLVINSLGIIQRVILIKEVNFKIQMIISTTAGVLSGGISISLAVLGFGVWSIVVQMLASQTIQTLLLCTLNKWKPSFIFNYASFKKLFHFGSKLLISGLIDTLFNNIASIIIGRMYPAAQLGFYSNAVKLRDVVVTSITSALQRVTYPVLSSIQDEEIRLKNGFRKAIKTSAYIIFPIMMGLIAIADTLIPLLFGSKWVESIRYFQLLCIAGALYPLHAINLNILQVKGRSDLFLLLEIIKKIVITILILIFLYVDLGIIGLIYAAILSSYVSLFINAYFSAKEISYSIFSQMRDIIPFFLISILMSGIAYLLGMISPDYSPLKLIIQISGGFIFYVIVSWLLRIKELQTIIEIIQPILLTKKWFSNNKLKKRSPI